MAKVLGATAATTAATQVALEVAAAVAVGESEVGVVTAVMMAVVEEKEVGEVSFSRAPRSQWCR